MALHSLIENKAGEAPSLPAFSNFSIHAVKELVTRLLELIGKDGIFNEYTRHDITHVDRLLGFVDWLVPSTTLPRLTVADCLLTTLAVYFHDLGMVVTRAEFDQREKSDFPKFRDKVLSATGIEGDYRDKIRRMPAEEADRFLYQEFVRENHAERVKNWIVGKPASNLGISDRLVTELNGVLEGLGGKFRKDLGLVCESHHRDDLNDLEKYRTSRPYGSDAQEEANLQYSAILLRTADLMHVTRDRAPSISFRIINPTDPRSIQEWHKQMPVVTVRPKPGTDKEGDVDPSAQMDTIEVHGDFTEPEGFFALTAYLNYARKELRRSYDLVQLAKKKKGSVYEFFWKDIDDSNCEAQGFVDKQFEFTLDQAKILDLLTGHTLYNDTTVVIRELAQNSLDAIRLQWEDEPGNITQGEVRIRWNGADRVLSISDNGTGMSQRVIDNHFLKVGSSLYQDDEFRKEHPHFSAISRFGIGVLSAFMISDEIEVTTCNPEDDQARTLSLRSLHGKYLVRLIEKHSSELPREILPHGTYIKVRVRPSAKLTNLLAIARRWIVFPKCKVIVASDGDEPVDIGFSEPKEALRYELTRLGLLKGKDRTGPPQDGDVKIEQRNHAGVTLAYAVEWSAYFREWQFLKAFDQREMQKTPPLIGTCVEGVRVGFYSPGYEGIYLPLAISNSVGPNAPKTNVARSGLEITTERRAMLENIYRLYCEHIVGEIEAMYKERTLSLTWALEEAEWLLVPLFAPEYRPTGRENAIDREALQEALSCIPAIALEHDGIREALSPKALSSHAACWTIDSAFFTSAEALIREVPAALAISKLAESLGPERLKLPKEPYISVGQRQRSILRDLAFAAREVDRIVIDRDQRRVDLRWRKIGTIPTWRSTLPRSFEVGQLVSRVLQEPGGRFRRPTNVYVTTETIDVTGLAGEIAVISMERVFIIPGSPYSQCVLDMLLQLETSPTPAKIARYITLLAALSNDDKIPDPAEFLRRQFARVSGHFPLGYVDENDNAPLLGVLSSTRFKVFDPRAWSRSSS
jgi:molecular chaperone HtpG